MMRGIISCFCFLMVVNTYAQETDSTRKQTLGLEQIVELVKTHHPIVRQAALQQGFAEAEIRTAKGLLDPKIGASYNQKQLKGTEYYDIFSGALKVPLWFPIDPKVEVNRAEGEYLNPERFISSSTDYWQVSTGVSLPIGKGLFIDERRATIKQAKLYTDMASAQQTKETNKILLTVIKSYWEWYFAYQQFELMSRSREIADELFDRSQLDFSFGEISAVDTVQALITLQSRIVDYEKASLALKQTRLALSVHLWGPDDVPVELTNSVIPTYSDNYGVVPSVEALDEMLAWASDNHPEIRKLNAKKGQLKIEERWNKESLKPELNLSYALIDSPLDYQGFSGPEWDNYKLGVDFSIPVFLRKERGKLQKTKLYIESTDYSIFQIQQEISANIKASYAELLTSQRLALQYQSMADNYQKLLDAEMINLENGESDLFKLNIQQDKYINAQRKYFEAELKFQKLKVTLPQIIGLEDLSYESMGW